MTAVLLTVLALEFGAMPDDAVVERFEEHEFVYTGGPYQDEAFKYRLLKPEPLEADKKYPVLLFLHGAGERGSDNRLQLLYLPEQMSQPEYRQKFPCFLIAPQCRPEQMWINANWGDEKSTMFTEPSDQMNVATGILDHVLKTYPVDSSRIYLTGLSMGGYGSWDLATRRPDQFAAVAPICGGGDEAHADKLVDIPIWAFHGDEDEAVPVERTRTMIAAIKKAGGEPKYTELKGVGHNSWTPAYTDPDGLLPWMFEQVNDRKSEK